MPKFLINGREYEAQPDEETTLLMLLRDHLGLTGTKYGCGEGQCGACTVLIDGAPRRSCTLDASEAVGKPVTTIEGLASGDELHPVQQAFLKHQAFQCGYCTAGMIMATAGLLQKNPSPTDEQIIQALDGNICRCGTYPRILAAVREAAASREEAKK